MESARRLPKKYRYQKLGETKSIDGKKVRLLLNRDKLFDGANYILGARKDLLSMRLRSIPEIKKFIEEKEAAFADLDYSAYETVVSPDQANEMRPRTEANDFDRATLVPETGELYVHPPKGASKIQDLDARISVLEGK